MKRTLFILILLSVCTGCQRELSIVQGVSVRQAQYEGWGQAHGSKGIQLWGNSISDLGGRSVSPEAIMPDDRIISFVDSDKHYDVFIEGECRTRGDLCREMLRLTFGVNAERASREIDVLILVPTGGQGGIEAAKIVKRPDVQTQPIEICRHGLDALLPRPSQRITHTFTSFNMELLAAWLEMQGDKVVLDETQLTGSFDFQLIDDSRNGITVQTSLASLGLELRPAKRIVSAVYVEPTGRPSPVKTTRLANYFKSSKPWWAVKPRSARN